MRKLVLWGHSPEEYLEMFDLSQDVWNKKILEFGCGLSAFNALQTKNGLDVVSCDPLFVLDSDTLKTKGPLIFDAMLDELRKAPQLFDFSRYGHSEQLISERREGMDLFFKDYVQGREQGRYVGVDSMTLPFDDFAFDYTLVSHYLFAGLDNQTVDFHLELIKELARVSREVRIFPIINRHGDTSEFLGPVLLGLQEANYGVEVRQVPYHLQEKGNAMLRVWAQECRV